jgi:TPR repeat protein
MTSCKIGILGRPVAPPHFFAKMSIDLCWPGPYSPPHCLCCLEGSNSNPVGWNQHQPQQSWQRLITGPPTPLNQLAQSVVFLSDSLSEVAGVKMNRKTARALLKRAADKGHPEALFRQGFMAQTGFACHVINLRQAEACYEGAALLGHGGAQFNLGMMLVNAPASTEAEQLEGIRWVQRAADQRVPQAQCVVGILRLRGSVAHIEIDPHEAYALFRQSAKHGVAAAACNLGAVCLSRADTVGKAKAWFDIAIDQNCPEGMFRLANMYWTGIGVEVSDRMACKLWHNAVLLGHRQASDQLRKIVHQIDLQGVSSSHAQFLRQVKEDVGQRRLRCWCCGQRKLAHAFTKKQLSRRRNRRCVQCTTASM